MPSGPQSGKFGIVHGGNPLAAVTMFNWAINDDMAPETYYKSNTRFGAQRNPGVNDWSGSFSMFTGYPIANNLPLMPGTLFSGEFFTAPDTGIYGNEGTIHYGNFIVDSLAITWQWQPSASLTTVVNFSGHGLLGQKKGVIDDLSLTTPEPMCLLDLQYSADGQAWDTWHNVLQATLNIVAANQPVVNSTTQCSVERKGGNIDWNLVVTEQETEELLTKSNNYQFRAHTKTDASQYWELKWGQIRSYNNINVNRQTGELISKDCNVDMNGIVSGALGHILFPDGTVWWPPAATTATVGFAGINEPPWDVPSPP